MKRIGTICAVGVLATLVLLGGCDMTSQPEPSIEKIDIGAEPAPKPVAPVTQVRSRPVVVIETSMGKIKVELWDDSAPVTVKNFLGYVDDKHFDGLIFHRVMQGFMIQGGGFDQTMNEKKTREPIPNEATADKKNVRGTLAMARTQVVDSATSQFFINLVNNGMLNHTARTSRGFGYCAFGKVIEGMDVVDKIAAVSVGNAGGHQNVPSTPVIINSIRRMK
jgi:cyclophilin family peptidyl-prolyl cis-trans isomerase